MITGLALYQKTYDLYLYTHKFVKKFPKSERFLISLELQQALSNAIKNMVKANSTKDAVQKRLYQEEIKSDLTIYTTHLRLAKDLNFFPMHTYEVAARYIEEIKRILAGWMNR